MDERLQRIQDKMIKSGTQVNPVISEDEITKFEVFHKIELPKEYRDFISKIGNGGQGPPYYGLAQLGQISPDMDKYQKVSYAEYKNIGRPFPFTKYWVWEDGDVSDEGSQDDLDMGCLYLGNDGCGMYWFLVITGRDRGIPWQICGEGAQPVCPKRDFLQWYEDWLDGKDSFYGFINR